MYNKSEADKMFDGMECIHIDWKKVRTIHDIKKVLQAYIGSIGIYTTDPDIKAFRKES